MRFNHLKSIRKLSLFILVIAVGSSFSYLSSHNIQKSFAQSTDTDFAVNGALEIYFENPSDFVTVKESITVKVNSEEFYLPKGSTQTFELPDFTFIKDESEREFKKASLKITDRYGTELTYTIKDEDDRLIVETKQLIDINPGQSYTFYMEYNTRELVERNGNIINLFAPGLPKNFDFWTKDKSGLTTSYSNEGRFIITGEITDISYLQPEGLQPNITDDKISITIPTQQRIGKSAWVQLGSEQYYYFKVIQEAPKTDNLTPTNLGKLGELISTNIFEIPLPREDDENQQLVFIEKITPEPTNIIRDEQGNLTAIFEVPANKQTDIEITGYITMSSSTSQAQDVGIQSYFESLKDGSLSDYKEYLLADKYWESESNEIKNVALAKAKEATTILQLARVNYDFVINHLDYSYDKLASENNIRAGALAAYTGAPSVCMEYSDLLIAIFRAQGVPARAVVGFGNDPTGSENNIQHGELLKQEIGHQWVQIWIPQYGWYSIDPTWGETGRTYLGANLDHILWLSMKSSSDEALSGTSLRSADSLINSSFSAYDVYLKALSKEEYTIATTGVELTELSNYLNRYDEVEYNELSYLLKGTLVGRGLIIGIPIFILIIVIGSIAIVITRLVKKKRKK